MSHILDTHVLLWCLDNNPKIPPRTRSVIADPARKIYVSAVSAIEIAIKHRIGKLPEAESVLPDLHERLEMDGSAELPVTIRHARLAGGMPGDHRDPFDRLLAAQALCDDLTIVPNDRMLDQFNVRRLW